MGQIKTRIAACLAAAVVVALIAIILPQSIVLKPLSTVNCLDWVLLNSKKNERMVWGFYIPTKQGHAWLKDGDKCRDIMNVNGFSCDDERYIEQPYINLHNESVLADILKTRAGK
jgi:hypothetical protein